MLLSALRKTSKCSKILLTLAIQTHKYCRTILKNEDIWVRKDYVPWQLTIVKCESPPEIGRWVPFNIQLNRMRSLLSSQYARESYITASSRNFLNTFHHPNPYSQKSMSKLIHVFQTNYQYEALHHVYHNPYCRRHGGPKTFLRRQWRCTCLAL